MEKQSLEIQQIRKHVGLSQSQFAERFHIKISTLQMWEQGINRTSETVLFLIKRILELEGDPFVPNKEDEPKDE